MADEPHSAVVRPILALWDRLVAIFHEETAGLEVICSVSVAAYASAFLLIAPADLLSAGVIVKILPGYIWPFISAAVAVSQFVAAISFCRRPRIVAALLASFWFIFMIRMGWAAVGPAPTLVLIAIFGIGGNTLVFYRHLIRAYRYASLR